MNERKLAFLATFIGGIYSTSKDCHFCCTVPQGKELILDTIRMDLEEITPCSVRPTTPEDCRKPRLRLHTRSHPIYSEVHERVYEDDKKRVFRPNIEAMTLAELALLIDFRGKVVVDKRRKELKERIDICMRGFDRRDCETLVEELYRSFGLTTIITINTDSHARGLRVQVVPKSYQKLLQLIGDL